MYKYVIRNTFLLVSLVVILAMGIYFLLSSRDSQVQSQDSSQPLSSIAPTMSITGANTTQLPKDCSGQVVPALTEGPYYKAGSPKQQMIRTNTTPTVKLILEGYVFDTDCQPVANAWIDFWQADGEGNYDNSGYNLRGYQYSDQNGHYKLETVIPGQYPGRTVHLHFKIRATDKSPLITSQLFLPDNTSNDSDPTFSESLLIKLTDNVNGDGKYATYNFVINK